jgi:hypothetical protein
VSEIKWDPESCNWKKITELGIFARRPWWQRFMSLCVRNWRHDVFSPGLYISNDGMGYHDGIQWVWNDKPWTTISASSNTEIGNTTTNADVPFTYTGGDHA